MTDNEMLKLAERIEGLAHGAVLVSSERQMIVSALRAAASAEPVGYGYSAEIQSARGRLLHVCRDREGIYDTPLYTAPAPDAEIVAALKAAREELVGHNAEYHRRTPQSVFNQIDAALAKAKGGSAPKPSCTHPNEALWFCRDGDTFMRCPDCGARWCK